MRYSDVLLEYKTKDGRNITFEIIEDEEGDKNRGWQVDRINAFVDGKPAGYLKLSYIPRERFDRYYPSIFNWMAQIKGKSVLPYDKRSTHWKTFSPDEKRETIKSIYGYDRYLSREKEEEISKLPDAELDNMLADAEKQAMKRYGQEFKGFETYFVDTPYEDYISVFDAGDSINPRSGSKERADADYKRQGIATAMYFKAVDYLAKKGMKMRLSTLRSKEGGEAIGDAIKKAGLTTPGKPFKHHKNEIITFDFLDPAKVKAYQKEHGINESLVEERTPEEEIAYIDTLISKLKYMSGRMPGEAAMFRAKIADLKAKRDRIERELTPVSNEPDPVKDYLPDFEKNTPPRKYTRTGGFEPFPFKTGVNVNTRA